MTPDFSPAKRRWNRSESVVSDLVAKIPESIFRRLNLDEDFMVAFFRKALSVKTVQEWEFGASYIKYFKQAQVIAYSHNPA